MDVFGFTDEQRAFAAAVRSFCVKECGSREQFDELTDHGAEQHNQQLHIKLASAGYLGVVTPRFLLRLPYGKDAAQTESFAFDEMPTPDHEKYLWGSGAVLCALLLAEGFVASGWDLRFEDGREVHNLPVHVYQDGGEATVKPCGEVLLRENALIALIDLGIMVLASLRDRDGVRLQRFQSAAQETTQIAGRW